jgi:hypothetical protein
MKKALISPNELRYGDEQKTQSGYRIAQVSDSTFEVASPLFWIDVPDSTIADSLYYDPNDEQLKTIWEEPEEEVSE